MSPNGATRRARRLKVFRRDRFTCQECGTRIPPPPRWRGEGTFGLTLGHVVPQWAGGDFSVGNLRTECQRCNANRGPRFVTDTDMVPRCGWKGVVMVPARREEAAS